MATTNTANAISFGLGLLSQAEAFLAGQPITEQIPQETFEIAGVKATIASTTITITK